VFKIAAVDGAVIQEALQLPFPDFEDAVTAAAASLAGCDYLVTRDQKGFRESALQAVAPEAVTPLL
jgi:predicted nucleic acid-binding protein